MIANTLSASPYLLCAGTGYHLPQFYKQCQSVVTDDVDTTARLKLVASAGVLDKTLGLMGMSAPEKM